MGHRITLALLIMSVIFLSGCKTTLVVHESSVKQIIPIFRDYVGSHGYKITYQNEATGSFNVDMGSVFVPYTSSTQKTKSTVQYTPTAGSSQPMTQYEETNWNTVANPAHYAQAAAAVTIFQQGSDVIMLLETNTEGGASLNDVKDYLQSLGYSVDNR